MHLTQQILHTYQILVASVDGKVAQSDGHGSDHLVRVGAQQLHQDGETFLLPHCGSDVVGPLEDVGGVIFSVLAHKHSTSLTLQLPVWLLLLLNSSRSGALNGHAL